MTLLIGLLAFAAGLWPGALVAGVQSERSPVGGDPSESVIRCFTPFLTGHDPSPDVLETAGMARVTDTIEVHAYESESGRFRLLYTTEGPDSVWSKETGIGPPGVPDYIALAAQYADSSYRYQVEQLGYTDPLNSTRCNPGTGPQLDIVFGDLRTSGGQKIYGYFDNRTPSRFFVNSTFSDPAFQRNDDDDKILGALKVTIAHELKHVIQYTTNCFSGNEINVNWLEMDATLMENVVFPNVNDYYNYIGGTAGIFGNPQTRFPRAYSHVTFMQYYHEDFGPGFWVDVWDEIGEDYLSGRNIPMLEAMQRVIDRYRGDHIAGVNGQAGANDVASSYGTADAYGTAGLYGPSDAGKQAPGAALPDLEKSLLRNYLWHLASGDRSLFNYGFSERENYPTSQVAGSFDEIPVWPDAPTTVPFHSARFYEFRADQMNAAGDVALALFNSELPLGIGFLGKAYNGEVFEFLVKAGTEKRQKLVFPVDWSHLDWLGIVTMNTVGGSSVNSLQLLAGEGPAIERIPYGNITKTGSITVEDAGWMLSRVLNPSATSPFDLFLADVSGNGTITPFDASLVLKNLENGTSFPLDDNLDNLGPEWSRFETIGNDDAPPAAPVWNKAARPAKSPSDHADPKTAPPDTVTAKLILLEDQVLAEQKMDIQLRVAVAQELQGGHAPEWSALYMDVEVDFPPDDGGMGPGDPISLEISDMLPGNMDPELRIWNYDDETHRLRFVFASSGPLASGFDPNGLLTLRIVPMNEGYIHFRIAELRLDEYVYTLDHPAMDTIRVMGPVFAGKPDDTDAEQPVALSLEQNYPNPFNPETMIRFSLPEAGHATLHLYDITGRRIATLADGFHERGEHQVRFDARDACTMSSGVYLYRLTTSTGGSLTRKMTMVK